MFLYLNVLLQRNQTGKSGWAGFRVPERYDCRTKDHVSYLKNRVESERSPKLCKVIDSISTSF